MPAPAEAVDRARPPAQQVRWTARATHRAMEGWPRVASEQDWLRILEESREAYESGGFLLERLGAERNLDPKLVATILTLRQRLIDEWAITTAAETMLVDLALLSYYNALRVQGWTGDLAVRIEHEFFGDAAFTEMAREGHRRTDRFAVEDRVRRLSEELMPLFDRANRMMLRNLKAIKELRQGQVPAIAIGRADHVTVTNRPNVRLRPVKTELPHTLSDPVTRTAETMSDTIEARPDFPDGAKRPSPRGPVRGRRTGATAQRATHAAPRSSQSADDPQSESDQRVTAGTSPRHCDRPGGPGDRHPSLRILPVFGPNAVDVSPRIGHIHVTVDDSPWRWADASGEPLIINCLPPGPHKVLIELVNANHQTLEKGLINFVVPVRWRGC